MSKLKYHDRSLTAMNFLWVIAIFLVMDCNAQSTPKRALLAISKTDHTLAIVDPASLKIVSKIPVGEDPHELVASTDGKTAYVCIYGGGSLHEINKSHYEILTQDPYLVHTI